MIKTELKTIGKHKYQCTMMPAMSANGVLIQLCETFGRPAIQAMVASQDDEAQVSEIAAITSTMLFEKLTPEKSGEMLVLVLGTVRCEGVTTAGFTFELINIHFAGILLDMYKVFAWALKVNYLDFLTAARSSDLLGGALTALTEVFNTSMPTPTSTESSATGAPLI